MTDFFLIISSIAIVISMFLIYFLFRGMQNDKKSANRPDIYPMKTTFTMTEFTFADNRLPFVLPVRVKQKAKDKNTSPSYIELINIGMGAAKQIKIEWIFEVNIIEELIRGIYDSNKKNFSNKEEIDFISPKDTIEIESPIYYFNKYGPKLKKAIEFEKESANELNENPLLKFKISYKDIYNQTYTKIFATTIESVGSKVTLNFKEER
jgi:hypothetical protein